MPRHLCPGHCRLVMCLVHDRQSDHDCSGCDQPMCPSCSIIRCEVCTIRVHAACAVQVDDCYFCAEHGAKMLVIAAGEEREAYAEAVAV